MIAQKHLRFLNEPEPQTSFMNQNLIFFLCLTSLFLVTFLFMIAMSDGKKGLEIKLSGSFSISTK
jgi:hypothetical protein